MYPPPSKMPAAAVRHFSKFCFNIASLPSLNQSNSASASEEPVPSNVSSRRSSAAAACHCSRHSIESARWKRRFWHQHGTSVRLGVTPRTVVGPLVEQMRTRGVPVLHGANGNSALQNRWGQLVVVKRDAARQRLVQVFARSEAVRAERIADAPVEALDHAVGLRYSGFGQPMLDGERPARHVELVPAAGQASARSERGVGEFLAAVGQQPGDPTRAGSVQRVARSIATNRSRPFATPTLSRSCRRDRPHPPSQPTTSGVRPSRPAGPCKTLLS